MIEGIDIFQPRQNGLPDFSKITPAQIFNGSAAAAANAMRELDPDNLMDEHDKPWLRRDGRRWTKIPGTDRYEEVRKARVIPEYINGRAARDRGHHVINEGGSNHSFTSGSVGGVDPPSPREEVGMGPNPSWPTEGPGWFPPMEHGYDPSNPISALNPPSNWVPGVVPPTYGIPGSLTPEGPPGQPPAGGYAPPLYSQPPDDDTDNMDPNLFNYPEEGDYNSPRLPQGPGSEILPPPESIEMKKGAMNRLPTILLDELKRLRFA